MNHKNFEIKPLTSEEIISLIDTIESFEISINLDAFSLINFGYHFLTDSSKIEYLFMKKIATSNFNKNGKMVCNASTEYLSIMYNTTIKTQKNIINSLIKYELISSSTEGYIIHPPLVETTFKENIYKLVFRKEINKTLSLITTCNNPKERLKHIQKVDILLKQQKEYPFLQEVFPSLNEQFKSLSRNF